MRPRAVGLLMVCLCALLAACAGPAASPASTPASRGGTRNPTPAPLVPTPAPGLAASPTPASRGGTSTPAERASALAPTPTPTSTRLPPGRWQEWPVLPALSARALGVLRDAQLRGANPRAFAKVGDCETLTDWFLVDFDRGPRYYSLGEYAALQGVIDYFAGSLGRKSLASARGFTAASALSPIWADPAACKPAETPLACEYRVQKPAFALIMLGTNDVSVKADFPANLKKLIEYSLEQSVLPVLATKADNLEGDESLNAAIAALAYEYELPLWNFWAAVQSLPDRGLQADGAHLTYAPNHFEDPAALQTAWAVRNLTALQMLEILRQGEAQARAAIQNP